MTLEQARKILGLAPHEDPRNQFANFHEAREQIASLIRTAPDPESSGRFMKGLIEFDEALAVIRKHFGPDPDPESARAIAVGAKKEPVEPPKRAGSYVAWFAGIFVLAAAGTWIALDRHLGAEADLTQRMQVLQKEGATLVEHRSWEEAREVYHRIEKLAPGSAVARQGRERIEAGMAEEQTQFIGYWLGQATAELEAGRLEEAEAAARQVQQKYPAESETTRILAEIAAARSTQARTTALAAARTRLDERDWDAAITAANALLAENAADPDAPALLRAAQAGKEKAAADRQKAATLLELAIARDQGTFDQQALDLLHEAKALDPANPAILAQLEKQSAYTRTLHVPGDFATPAEALAGARDRDRIVLAAGDWQGPLVINAAVELQGVGQATTRIQCPPSAGSPLTIGPDAKEARVSGITFRHESFAIGDDRFAAALVRGGSVTFTDCRFTEASGHGLAVIEGGSAKVSRSRFTGNGWDGAAAIGTGTRLEVRDSEALENYQHGIESWDGASAVLIKNRCEGNSRNGIHADNHAAAVIIEENQLLSNREFGLVLDSAASGRVAGNRATGNHLGGIVLRAGSSPVTVTANQATLNQGPGIVLEKGLSGGAYADNVSNQNAGEPFLTNADLTAPPADVIPAAETTAPVHQPAPTPPLVPEPAPPRAIVAPEPAIPRARIVPEPGR